jgi:hypothetical protein
MVKLGRLYITSTLSLPRRRGMFASYCWYMAPCLLVRTLYPFSHNINLQAYLQFYTRNSSKVLRRLTWTKLKTIERWLYIRHCSPIYSKVEQHHKNLQTYPQSLYIWFTNYAGASLSFLFLSCCTSLRVVLLRRFAPEAFSMSRLVTSARTFVDYVYGQSFLHAGSAKGHLRSSFVVCLKHFCLCQSKDVLRTFDKVGPRSKIF